MCGWCGRRKKCSTRYVQAPRWPSTMAQSKSHFPSSSLQTCVHTHQVAELEGKVKEMMMLKFGQVVDLDRLEGLGTNRIVEELRGRLRALEHQSRQDMAELETQVETERHRLVAVTRENTHRLDQLHELLTAQTQVEQRLNGRQKSIVSLSQ